MSFESLKKVEDDAHAREEDNESGDAAPSTSPSRQTAASPSSIGNNYARTERGSARRTRS
jgi:hypothetical protein